MKFELINDHFENAKRYNIPRAQLRFKKYIGKDDVCFDYGAVDCYYLATKSTCREPR